MALSLFFLKMPKFLKISKRKESVLENLVTTTANTTEMTTSSVTFGIKFQEHESSTVTDAFVMPFLQNSLVFRLSVGFITILSLQIVPMIFFGSELESNTVPDRLTLKLKGKNHNNVNLLSSFLQKSENIPGRDRKTPILSKEDDEEPKSKRLKTESESMESVETTDLNREERDWTIGNAELFWSVSPDHEKHGSDLKNISVKGPPSLHDFFERDFILCDMLSAVMKSFSEHETNVHLFIKELHGSLYLRGGSSNSSGLSGKSESESDDKGKKSDQFEAHGSFGIGKMNHILNIRVKSHHPVSRKVPVNHFSIVFTILHELSHAIVDWLDPKLINVDDADSIFIRHGKAYKSDTDGLSHGLKFRNVNMKLIQIYMTKLQEVTRPESSSNHHNIMLNQAIENVMAIYKVETGDATENSTKDIFWKGSDSEGIIVDTSTIDARLLNWIKYLRRTTKEIQTDDSVPRLNLKDVLNLASQDDNHHESDKIAAVNLIHNNIELMTALKSYATLDSDPEEANASGTVKAKDINASKNDLLETLNASMKLLLNIKSKMLQKWRTGVQTVVWEDINHDSTVLDFNLKLETLLKKATKDHDVIEISDVTEESESYQKLCNNIDIETESHKSGRPQSVWFDYLKAHIKDDTAPSHKYVNLSDEQRGILIRKLEKIRLYDSTFKKKIHNSLVQLNNNIKSCSKVIKKVSLGNMDDKKIEGIIKEIRFMMSEDKLPIYNLSNFMDPKEIDDTTASIKQKHNELISNCSYMKAVTKTNASDEEFMFNALNTNHPQVFDFFKFDATKDVLAEKLFTKDGNDPGQQQNTIIRNPLEEKAQQTTTMIQGVLNSLDVDLASCDDANDHCVRADKLCTLDLPQTMIKHILLNVKSMIEKFHRSRPSSDMICENLDSQSSEAVTNGAKRLKSDGDNSLSIEPFYQSLEVHPTSRPKEKDSDDNAALISEIKDIWGKYERSENEKPKMIKLLSLKITQLLMKNKSSMYLDYERDVTNNNINSSESLSLTLDLPELSEILRSIAMDFTLDLNNPITKPGPKSSSPDMEIMLSSDPISPIDLASDKSGYRDIWEFSKKHISRIDENKHPSNMQNNSMYTSFVDVFGSHAKHSAKLTVLVKIPHYEVWAWSLTMSDSGVPIISYVFDRNDLGNYLSSTINRFSTLYSNEKLRFGIQMPNGRKYQSVYIKNDNKNDSGTISQLIDIESEFRCGSIRDGPSYINYPHPMKLLTNYSIKLTQHLLDNMSLMTTTKEFFLDQNSLRLKSVALVRQLESFFSMLLATIPFDEGQEFRDSNIVTNSDSSSYTVEELEKFFKSQNRVKAKSEADQNMLYVRLERTGYGLIDGYKLSILVKLSGYEVWAWSLRYTPHIKLTKFSVHLNQFDYLYHYVKCHKSPKVKRFSQNLVPDSKLYFNLKDPKHLSDSGIHSTVYIVEEDG